MSDGIILSKKHGLNPTIVACPYCGEAKNQLLLTGLEGEKWAKKHGIESGEMPKYVLLEDDIEPCDECKKAGVAMVEVDSEENKTPTGRKWLIKEDVVKWLFEDPDTLKEVLNKRIFLMDKISIDECFSFLNDNKDLTK